MRDRYAKNSVDLLKAIVTNALAVDKDNTEARLKALAYSIKGERFDADDCFELDEIIQHGVKAVLDSIPDRDFNDFIGYCLESVGYRNKLKDIERTKEGEKYRAAVNSFKTFLKNNSYGTIADYDRFKPIYEKFVQINEDIDSLVGDDILTFFKEFQASR